MAYLPLRMLEDVTDPQTSGRLCHGEGGLADGDVDVDVDEQTPCNRPLASALAEVGLQTVGEGVVAARNLGSQGARGFETAPTTSSPPRSPQEHLVGSGPGGF